MSNGRSIHPHPLWRAAEHMSKAVDMMEHNGCNVLIDGYEEIAKCLTAAYSILMEFAAPEKSRKNVEKAIKAIDLAMGALSPLQAQWRLMNDETETVDIGDLKIELGDHLPAETRIEVMGADTEAWLGDHSLELKTRAAKLRSAASQAAAQDESGVGIQMLDGTAPTRVEVVSAVPTCDKQKSILRHMLRQGLDSTVNTIAKGELRDACVLDDDSSKDAIRALRNAGLLEHVGNKPRYKYYLSGLGQDVARLVQRES